MKRHSKTQKIGLAILVFVLSVGLLLPSFVGIASLFQ